MRISEKEAAERLKNGDVIVIPTDTVYGLAAIYNNKLAIQKIFEIKNRSQKSPLVLFIRDEKELKQFVKLLPPDTKKLIQAYWPGPLTIIFPARKEAILPIIRSSLSTIAIRIPSHPLALSLIKKTGPLVVTSANLSGQYPIEDLSEMETTFGASFPILESSLPPFGEASTIISYRKKGWYIKRVGALSPLHLYIVLGYPPEHF